jgi:2-dehydropantoate 2-reductase
MNNQNIYIIGAGAIGKVLATFLILNRKNVRLIRGSIDHQAVVHEKIQVELSDHRILEASVEVSTLSNFDALDGIVVLTNKSFGNENLSTLLKSKIGTSPIVILQNGLGVEQPFTENGFPEIYRCVLFATSQPLSQSTIRFKPVSVSLIGTIKGNHATLSSIVSALDTPNFQFKAENNIEGVIWKKAVINSVFNSICPLLEIDNGIFDRNETAQAIAKRVIKECVAIANESGITIDENDVLERLLLVSKTSDGQLISTLQDIRNKKETEIDTLNFSIVRIARNLNKESIVTETKLLGELTKLKSELKSLSQ